MGNGNDSRNSIHMYIDDRLQAFVAHQEATVIFVVHKQVFRQHCRAHRITDNRKNWNHGPDYRPRDLRA